MATIAETAPRTAPLSTERSRTSYRVMRLLQFGFVVAPTLAGLDKFFQLMTNWDQYLAPVLARNLGGHTFMLVVGVVEIAAGLLVALKPRIGGLVVAAWLAGIILNLALTSLTTDARYWDIALRDVGLMIGALSLAMLAASHERRRRLEAGATGAEVRGRAL